MSRQRALEVTSKHIREGDGIVASIVSSRDGLLASYTLHNRSADAGVEPIAVKHGDTIDFALQPGFEIGARVEWIGHESPNLR